MPFDYVVHGLLLRANRVIPGLLFPPRPSGSIGTEHQPAGSQRADVVIEFEPRPARSVDSLGEWVGGTRLSLETGAALREYTASAADGLTLRQQYTDGREWAEFVISPAGDSIRIHWSPAAPLQDIFALLLGPVVGRVLRWRGVVCLHANALSVHGRAIALAGDKGTGKSTTTAALLQVGCGMISDDIAALQPVAGHYIVPPGHPSLRLWRETAERLFPADMPLRPVWTQGEGRPDKCYVDLSGRPGAFATQCSPLAAIYILEERERRGAEPAVESVSQQQALLSLVKHTFANDSLTAKQRADEFAFLGHLVRQVPVRRVRRPDALELLPRVAELIVEDARRLSCNDVLPVH